MPVDRLSPVLSADLADRQARGLLKGAESVVTEVVPARGEHGPRYRLAGEGDRPFDLGPQSTMTNATVSELVAVPS
nr:hypothetical protein [Thermoanaerobaculia bacterium]